MATQSASKPLDEAPQQQQAAYLTSLLPSIFPSSLLIFSPQPLLFCCPVIMYLFPLCISSAIMSDRKYHPNIYFTFFSVEAQLIVILIL